MQDEAIDSYLQTEERLGLPGASVTKLRQAYAKSGWQGYWRKRLDLLNADAKQEPVPPLFLAEIYSRVGDKDKAFEFLQRAYEVREMSLVFIKVDPIWTSLRPDPRFTALLQRLHLN